MQLGIYVDFVALARLAADNSSLKPRTTVDYLVVPERFRLHTYCRQLLSTTGLVRGEATTSTSRYVMHGAHALLLL